MTCGDKSHRTSSCPRGKSGRRSPTPYRQNSSHPRQKVNFRVSRVEDPQASGREGDVTDADEEAVEAYLAARAIGSYMSESEKE